MRLIDADVLIKDLDDAIQDAKSKGEICDYWEDDRSNLLHYLDSAPTVDAVKVVRCRDCKFYQPFDLHRKYDCTRGLLGVVENGFCSFGKKERSE